MNIRSLDVHLLRCFDALMAELSVSRAAEQMNLSQPAMSHALARLRRLFGRAGLEKEEVNILRGILARIDDVLSR